MKIEMRMQCCRCGIISTALFKSRLGDDMVCMDCKKLEHGSK